LNNLGTIRRKQIKKMKYKGRKIKEEKVRVISKDNSKSKR